MRKFYSNLIVKSIQKVTGRGAHKLHEPLFAGKEINYLKARNSKKDVEKE